MNAMKVTCHCVVCGNDVELENLLFDGAHPTRGNCPICKTIFLWKIENMYLSEIYPSEMRGAYQPTEKVTITITPQQK